MKIACAHTENGGVPRTRNSPCFSPSGAKVWRWVWDFTNLTVALKRIWRKSPLPSSRSTPVSVTPTSDAARTLATPPTVHTESLCSSACMCIPENSPRYFVCFGGTPSVPARESNTKRDVSQLFEPWSYFRGIEGGLRLWHGSIRKTGRN